MAVRRLKQIATDALNGVRIASGVQREFLSVAEAEAWTGISRWTFRRWAYDGKIASHKLSRRLLIPVSEVRRVLAEGMRPRSEV